MRTTTALYNGNQPVKATEGSSGYDLCFYPKDEAPLTLHAGQTALLDTGLCLQIPKGLTGMVCSRSGLAIKHGVHVLNAPASSTATIGGRLASSCTTQVPTM